MIDFFNINGGGGSGGDGSSLNVFAQLEEPDIKKGIWLKAEKEIQHIETNIPTYYGDGTQ